MAKVTLRFVNGGGFGSDLIRQAELGFEYSHVECQLPDGSLLGALLDGGVAIRPQGYDKGLIRSDLLVDVSVSEIAAETFYTFLKAQVGQPYDPREIAEIAFGFASGRSSGTVDGDGWICSELINAAARQAGIIKASIKPGTPRDTFVWAAALSATPLP